MKSMKFTDSELSELKTFYQREQEKINERLATIKGILNTITADERAIVEQNADLGPNLPKKNSKTKEKKISKSKWGTFILELLQQQNKPVKVDYIIEAAIQKFNAPKSQYRSVAQSIVNSSFRLRNQRKAIRSVNTGTKGVSLALTSWFDKEGKLKENYKETPDATLKIKEQPKKKTVTKIKTSSETNKTKSSDSANWRTFIVKTLKEENKLLPAKILTKKAMQVFKIDKKLYEKTRQLVARAASSLDKDRKVLKSYSKAGTAGRYYGLSEWFGANGKLGKTYIDKIE